MKTVCIYHSIDLDGWMSIAIVKHWFITKYAKDHLEYEYNVITKHTKAIYKGEFETIKFDYPSITFIGYNYGQPIPDLSEYDKVIMCDISFPKEEMVNIVKRIGLNFIWLDHHISAINSFRFSDLECGYYPDGIRDTSYAACELTWKYFFYNEPMPEIVRLLGRYDCFGYKGTKEEQKVLEFQYGAIQVITNYKEAYVYLTQSLITPTLLIDNIHSKGKNIYQHLCTKAE